MSREVRRVPANWEHPKNEYGNYVPLFEFSPTLEPAEIEEGLREGWLEDDPPNYGQPVMPDWPDAERTHYQMYEDTTEGTPISPVMESPEALAHWLADNGASSFGSMTTTYESRLKMIQVGSSMGSMVVDINTGHITSGVDALLEKGTRR